jgi:hypothetical protein
VDLHHLLLAGLPAHFESFQLITAWLEVRVLPGPPCVFSGLIFVGFFAVFDSGAHRF